MERLRHVARSGGADPAVIVAETVDALTTLGPAPSELVPLCRNLVERNPTCGPLWWLCAHLLAKPEALDTAWTWAEQVERDGTSARLAERLPDEAAVMTVGYPAITARALRRCGNVSVLAVMAGDEGSRLVRVMDRAGVDVEPLVPEAMLAALAPRRPRRARGRGLLDRRRRRVDRKRSRGRRRRCGGRAGVARRRTGTAAAGSYVDVIGRTSDADHETFPTTHVSNVVGPDGVVPMSSDAFGAECPAIPELLPS